MDARENGACLCCRFTGNAYYRLKMEGGALATADDHRMDTRAHTRTMRMHVRVRVVVVLLTAAHWVSSTRRTIMKCVL